jgi:hypothetical protein
VCSPQYSVNCFSLVAAVGSLILGAMAYGGFVSVSRRD